jgi:hypothetical protein
MKRIYILTVFLFIITAQKINAQGCVAIRSNGNSCGISKAGDSKGWQLNINNRYFKSYKHFVGTEEQKQRVEEGTEVINYSFSWDFTLTRNINKYWSWSANIPLLSNVRSSMYEHYGNSSTNPLARNKTKSFGLGDIRFTAYRWLLDPEKSPKGNIQLGLGVKFATGDYQVNDFFHKAGVSGDSTVLGPVDQSIQLGDGGTGVAVEVNGYKSFNHQWGVYGNFYYLSNPREQNGVSTSRGGAASTTNVRYFSHTMSVPDQFMIRGGANFMVNKLTFSGGVRIEGIPSSDLIGGDKGFRRPGYVISAEPTVLLSTKKANFYLSVPFALKRNRIQSYSDKLRSTPTNKVQGDAAFADYLINAGFSIHL